MDKNHLLRRSLIKQLEECRKSRVLAYVTSDRPGVTGQIGEDAVRYIVEHLRGFEPSEKLDLFLYSRGGGMDVPWHLVSALRSVSKKMVRYSTFSSA